MRITINCRSILTRHPTGIGRYVHHLVDSLARIDNENQYFLYVPKKLIDFQRHAPQFSFTNKNFQIKTDCFKKGAENAVGPFDIYHSPFPGMINVQKPKVIVTVHDLIYKTFPAGHTEDAIKKTDEAFRDFIPKAERIICCSENTRRDLHQHFNFPREKSVVIYQGVDHRAFYPLSDNQKAEAKEFLKALGVEAPYILFVGTIEPRKNLVNLLKAFAILKEKNKFSGKLIIAGMKGWLSEGNTNLIKELGIEDSIQFLGYVTDETLRYLYNWTEAFVFPSLYEGFGFPILEAFCCGAPVVTSRLSSCEEVAKDGALMTDPHDPQKMAIDIAAVIGDPHLKLQLKMKGLRRAQEFSFTKTAQETLNLYYEVSGIKSPASQLAKSYVPVPAI